MGFSVCLRSIHAGKDTAGPGSEYRESGFRIVVGNHQLVSVSFYQCPADPCWLMPPILRSMKWLMALWGFMI